PVQPGRERLRRFEARQRLPDADEDVLRQVRCVRVAADHLEDDVVYAPLILLEKLLERVEVPSLSAAHQVGLWVVGRQSPPLRTGPGNGTPRERKRSRSLGRIFHIIPPTRSQPARSPGRPRRPARGTATLINGPDPPGRG